MGRRCDDATLAVLAAASALVLLVAAQPRLQVAAAAQDSNASAEADAAAAAAAVVASAQAKPSQDAGPTRGAARASVDKWARRPADGTGRGARHRRRVSSSESSAARKPILNEFSFPANLVQGMRFVLMCQVLDGEPPIQMRWLKDELELERTSPQSLLVHVPPAASANGNSNGNGNGNAIADAAAQNSPSASHLLAATQFESRRGQSASDDFGEIGADETSVELVQSDESVGASQLVFRRVRQAHSGNYTCIASNQHGSASYSAVMNVKVAPSWRVEPTDSESVVGEQITIDCQANGNPRPFIRWKFTPTPASSHLQQQQQQQQQQQRLDASLFEQNSATAAARLVQQLEQAPSASTAQAHQLQQQQQQQPLPQPSQPFRLINSNHHVQTLENGSLAIRSVGREHAGAYICEAANGVAPNLVKQIRLIVRSPAQLPDDIQVSIATSRGEPILTGVPNGLTGSGGGGGGVGQSQALLFPSQSEQSLFGAVVTQTHASNHRTQTGNPIQQQQQQQQFAKSVRLAQNTTNVRLSCRPLGDLPMQIEWLKDDRLVHSHSISAIESAAAAPVDAGSEPRPPPSPVPAPSGGGGVAGGTSAALGGRYRVGTRWLEKSAFKQLQPHQQQQQQLQQHQQQQQQTLSDSLVGGQAEQVHSRALESELVFVAPLNRLDAAKYSCVVRNAYGFSERKLRLVVMEPPEAPQLVDVAHISSRSIGLRWSVPFDGNSPILKYIVEYRRASAGADERDPFEQQSAAGRSEKLVPLRAAPSPVHQLVELVGQAPYLSQQQQSANTSVVAAQVHHTLHDLEPLTRYSVRVVSVNALGQSRPSVALSLRTTEEVPSTVPTSVSAHVISSKSIKLHWTIQWSPEHEIIEGFFVGYRSFDPTMLGPDAGAHLAPLSPPPPPPPPDRAARPLTRPHNESQSAAADQSAQDKQQVAQSTFTYKTIRLAAAAAAGAAAGNGAAAAAAVDTPPHLAPVASVTKTVPLGAMLAPAPNAAGPAAAAAARDKPEQLSQQVVVSSFEYIIAGLERNTEYSILIQCFNRKGAGPSSDPVVFRTLSHDPPEKLALNVDQSNESSLNLSWHFIRSQLAVAGNGDLYGSNVRAMMQLSSKSSAESEPIDGFVLAFARHPNAGRQVQAPQVITASSSQHALKKQPQPPTDGSSVSTSPPPPPPPPAATGTRSVSYTAGNASAIYLGPRIGQQQQASSQFAPSQMFQSPSAGAGAADSELQWQALQLSAQVRQHQLKNLDCGTQYALKIWAFNKVGKGEPSDLLWTSTRGKAPVAPDKRSFLAINSTQVRLHLSAWYDGGCDIERFIVQYKARGENEWVLVSNNILREQVGVLIRDLAPASAYELLVGAQNQVGQTEARYRFNTLDASGRPVFAQRASSASSSSFFGNLASALDDAVEGNEFSLVDYDNDNHATRRELWRETGDDDLGVGSSSAAAAAAAAAANRGPMSRWLVWLRQVMNSSITLLFILFVLIVLLVLFVFNRSLLLSNGSSTGTLGLADKYSTGGSGSGSGNSGSGAASAPLPTRGDSDNLRDNFAATLSGAQISNMSYMDTEPALSVAGNGSITDSPRLTDYGGSVTCGATELQQQKRPQRHQLAADRSHGYAKPSYASATASAMTLARHLNGYAAADNEHNFDAPATSGDVCAAAYVTTVNNGACNRQLVDQLKHNTNPYASVHRSATLDSSSMLANAHHRQQQQQQQQQQQCLVQMLMMDAAQQQQQQQQQHSSSRQMFGSLTLGKHSDVGLGGQQQTTAGKLVAAQHQQSAAATTSYQLSQQQQHNQFANSLTLGRLSMGEMQQQQHQHQQQQQQVGCFSGATSKKTCDNSHTNCSAETSVASTTFDAGQHATGGQQESQPQVNADYLAADQYQAAVVNHAHQQHQNQLGPNKVSLDSFAIEQRDAASSIYQMDAFNSAMTMSTSGRGTATSTFGGG